MKSIAIVILALITSVAQAALTENGSYTMDPDHAHIGFSVSHLGFSNVIGRFNRFGGTVNFEANGASKVDFTIDASSVDTNQSRRDTHIKSADFFNVNSFPKIRFISTAVEYSDSGDPKTITGKLNLHGKTQSVTFEVIPVGAGEFDSQKRAGYMATTRIDRNDFGIDTFSGVVGDEIIITVNLELIKQ